MLSKRVLQPRNVHITWKGSPPGKSPVFSQNGGKLFSVESFPEISGENVVTVSPGKVFLKKFPTKVSRHKLCKSLIYRLQSIM